MEKEILQGGIANKVIVVLWFISKGTVCKILVILGNKISINGSASKIFRIFWNKIFLHRIPSN